MRTRGLVDQARAVEAEVRFHKRSVQRHRGMARDAARRLAALRQECERLGIHVSFVTPEPDPGRRGGGARA